ncbi:MAG: hypothetical protein JXQ23_13980 [Clostridia bacterium]|nr:hypothetical protein [Clostridia bacterium]
MILFSVLWVLLLLVVPATLNKFSVFKINFWVWFIAILLLNIGYFVTGLFRKFRKLKKIWIPLLSGVFLFYAFYYLLNSFIYMSLSQISYYYLSFPLLLGVVTLVLSRDKKSVINRIAVILSLCGTGIYLYQKIMIGSVSGMLLIIGSAMLFALYLFMVNKDKNKVFITIYFSAITGFLLSLAYLLLKSSFTLPSFKELATFGLMGIIYYLLTLCISYSYKLSDSSKTVSKAYSLVLVYFAYFELFRNSTYQLKDLVAVIIISIAIILTFFDQSI